MANSHLVLHCGAVPVTAEQLQQYKAPRPTGRWFPIAHSRVLSVVTESLQEAGFSIAGSRLAVLRNGSRFFGVMDLKNPVIEGVALAVGIRNSVDKSYAELNVMPDWVETCVPRQVILLGRLHNEIQALQRPY